VARTVLVGEEPVRYAAHTPDDDWWLSDGRTDPSDSDAHLVAQIHHVLDRDPTLGELATLPIGSEAHRDVVGGDWTVGAFKWAPDDQGT